MADHLFALASNAKARVARGYYDGGEAKPISTASIVKLIKQNHRTPVITEIKFASPSAGKIRESGNILQIAKAMVDGGATGISVLTDPDNFEGSLDALAEVSQNGNVPTIMKDIIVSPKQLLAGRRAGASAVVLISELFSQGLADFHLEQMIIEARRLGLEAIVEANSPQEFANLTRYRPDVYGINNRNLSTFEIDLSTTEKILAGCPEVDGPILSESGIESSEDIKRLRAAGADAFLVGTSVMKSADIQEKVKEMVNA